MAYHYKADQKQAEKDLSKILKGLSMKPLYSRVLRKSDIELSTAKNTQKCNSIKVKSQKDREIQKKNNRSLALSDIEIIDNLKFRNLGLHIAKKLRKWLLKVKNLGKGGVTTKGY